MKIDDILFGQQTGNKTTGKKTTSETNFKDLLTNQAQQAGASGQVTESGTIAPSPPISAALRLEGLQLSEKTINTLESFGAALENVSLASEDLEPFVAALEEETTALLDLQEELPQEDPLAKLLNRIATVTYLETEKYRRGDYSG